MQQQVAVEIRRDAYKDILSKYARQALPQDLEMSRDLDVVPLHPRCQAKYQKKHRLHFQELPSSDKARQAQVLKKALQSPARESKDEVTQVAIEVLQRNQVGLLDIKNGIAAEKRTAFCQSVNICCPNEIIPCFNLYVGGLEVAGLPCFCVCYYKTCVAKAKCKKKFEYENIDDIVLPNLYLVDVSVLKNFEGSSMPSFETLKERDMISVYKFDRSPEFTFVSHKWSGNSPDDANNSLFREIKSTMTGYVWVDYMCVPQAGSFDVRLPFLKSIPYVIIASSHVWTPMKTNDYRRSVWCNMEQFLEKDEGLALVEEFRIQNVEDLAPIILGLKEVLQLLLIHSTDYINFVGKFIIEPNEPQGSIFCNPLAIGSAKYLVFERPEMHMINPTLSRICEYYLIQKYSL